MPYTIAIDEAGRGPVIGPLVLAAVLVNKDHESKLSSLGVKDSKLLSSEKREEMFVAIKELVEDFRIISVPAQELDDLMKSINLNMIEALKSVEMINDLNGDSVILDCPSTNVNAYADIIKAKVVNKEMTIRAQHKADEKYVSVGAASILAKVTRDREIQRLKEKYNVDFGSGYMSDVLTKRFIDEYYDSYPELFRTSWKSWKKRSFAKDQKSLDIF